MYANYHFVDYNTRVALGNTTASAYASSVLADFVGMLTGTIVNVSQLSDYANKPLCVMQGNPGDWEVYDADAHPSYPGTCKVLRRLRVDALGYQYMFIGFRMAATDYLNGHVAFMGGWDSVNKAPTTKMSGYTPLSAGTVISSSNVSMNNGSYATGTSNSYLWNQATAQSNPPIPWRILSTPSVAAFWPDPAIGATQFPVHILGEYQTLHPWSNSANGMTPLLFASGNQGGEPYIIAPDIRNTIGNLVEPDYAAIASSAGNRVNSGVVQGNWADASRYIYDYTRDASGNKVIPVLPIDVNLRVNVAGYYCYAGRMLGLFATLPFLYPGDTFMVGADTYIVIPVGDYNADQTDYSPIGKLCAKIE